MKPVCPRRAIPVASTTIVESDSPLLDKEVQR